MSGLATIAVTPALPLHEAGKYVAAAYVFAFVLILVYVAIMAIRLGRVERELGELLELAETKTPEASELEPREPVGAPSR